MEKKAFFLKVIPENRSDYLNLSVSKVKVFKSCKAKFYFQYIKKLPKKEQEASLFGSFLHEVLERFEIYILAGCKDPDNVIMKKCFLDSLNGKAFPKQDGTEELLEDQIIWSQKLDSEQKKYSFDILCQFLRKRKELKDAGTLPRVIMPEKSFNIKINNDILLNGFIDVVQIDPDGVLHVCDYKTSKHKKYLKNDFMQLKTYAYAMCLEDPDLQVVRCSYIMLKFDFDYITKEFTRKEVMASTAEYEKYAEDIRAEKLFRPTPTPLCDYCDFLDECPDGQNKVGIFSKKFGETAW